jgi:hypothetical protein
MYNDAEVNILEETLPFQLKDKSRKNPKCRNYDHVDSTRLAQTFFRICAFYKVRGCGII